MSLTLEEVASNKANCDNPMIGGYRTWVDSRVARQLERELAAALKAKEEAERDAERYREALLMYLNYDKTFADVLSGEVPDRLSAITLNARAVIKEAMKK